MPLFQFLCSDCEADSEVLVRSDEEIRCPECDSVRLVKQLSAIRPMNGGTAEPVGCGASSCCQMMGGACMN